MKQKEYLHVYIFTKPHRIESVYSTNSLFIDALYKIQGVNVTNLTSHVRLSNINPLYKYRSKCSFSVFSS